MTDQLDNVRRALGQKTQPTSDFDLNPDVVLPADRKLRPAGVLIGLINGPSGLDVILTKRSSRLKHHPGQIAFPGGKQDADDANVVDAALREAYEEIGLPRDLVSVMGTLPTHETVTGFIVTPVVAFVGAEFTAQPEPGEVSEVFRVPLSHVTTPSRFAIEGRRWRGHRRQYYTVPFGPYYIWGATARILRLLTDQMSQ